MPRAMGFLAQLQSRAPRSRLLTLFLRRDEGNIAILFVFMLGVLMFFAGGAIDFTRYNIVRTDLVESLDASGLAIAQIDAMNGPELQGLTTPQREALLKERGREFFAENFKHASLVENLAVDFVITSTTITPTAAGTLKTLLLPVGDLLVSGSPSSSLAHLSLDTDTEITRARAGNIEVGVVLDTTGSMDGDKIDDLKEAAKELVDILVLDDQTDFYTKVALAPYSVGVELGGYADEARGDIPAAKSITNATWKSGSTKNISNASWKQGSSKAISNVEKLNPVRVTANSHGFSNGDIVWIEGVSSSGSGANKMSTQINNKTYTVTSANTNNFRLSGVNGTGWSGSYQSSSNDKAQECKTSSCEVVVTTSSSHGFLTGDYVYVDDVEGMEDLNGEIYQVTKIDNTNVALTGAVGTSFDDYEDDGEITKCLTANCEVVVTASGHGFATDDHVRITNVGGMTQINNTTWEITAIDANTFSLDGSTGPNYYSYSSNGSAWCTTLGCEYYYFEKANGDFDTFQITTCVSERIGDEAYTDASPEDDPVGYVYADDPCGSEEITPLSSDKDALKDAIDEFDADGATAGQIGVAWGWYLVSPNFGSMFPADSQPAAYSDDDVSKAVVIMTDGEFNSAYCNGVLSDDSNGNNSKQIDCDATNGDGFSQTEELCDGMKAVGIRVYTVGFMIGGMQAAEDILVDCATTPAQAYIADDGDELIDAFESIAQDIARLHISK